jgi:hypothetical protein
MASTIVKAAGIVIWFREDDVVVVLPVLGSEPILNLDRT